MLKEEIKIKVGSFYRIDLVHPSTKKARENNGREVELLGFSDVFMGDAIVRYKDTGRRGRVPPSWLIPISSAIK